MNLNFINMHFNRLKEIENYLNYEFEPRYSEKCGKRNIFYEDLREEFSNEVNTYGFSPFVLETFSKQKTDPNILKFLNKEFNHGLTNYIRKQHHNIHELSKTTKSSKLKNLFKKITKNKREKDGIKVKNKDTILIEALLRHGLLVKNNDKKSDIAVPEKKNFLQKALGNTGNTKLNISSSEEDSEREKKNAQQNNQKQTINEEKTYQIIHSLIDLSEKIMKKNKSSGTFNNKNEINKANIFRNHANNIGNIGDLYNSTKPNMTTQGHKITEENFPTLQKPNASLATLKFDKKSGLSGHSINLKNIMDDNKIEQYMTKHKKGKSQIRLFKGNDYLYAYQLLNAKDLTIDNKSSIKGNTINVGKNANHRKSSRYNSLNKTIKQGFNKDSKISYHTEGKQQMMSTNYTITQSDKKIRRNLMSNEFVKNLTTKVDNNLKYRRGNVDRTDKFLLIDNSRPYKYLMQ